MTALAQAQERLRRARLELVQLETALHLARVDLRIAVALHAKAQQDALWDRALIRVLRHDTEGERT